MLTNLSEKLASRNKRTKNVRVILNKTRFRLSATSLCAHVAALRESACVQRRRLVLGSTLASCLTMGFVSGALGDESTGIKLEAPQISTSQTLPSQKVASQGSGYGTEIAPGKWISRHSSPLSVEGNLSVEAKSSPDAVKSLDAKPIALSGPANQKPNDLKPAKLRRSQIPARLASVPVGKSANSTPAKLSSSGSGSPLNHQWRGRNAFSDSATAPTEQNAEKTEHKNLTQPVSEGGWVARDAINRIAPLRDPVTGPAEQSDSKDSKDPVSSSQDVPSDPNPQNTLELATPGGGDLTLRPVDKLDAPDRSLKSPEQNPQTPDQSLRSIESLPKLPPPGAAPSRPMALESLPKLQEPLTDASEPRLETIESAPATESTSEAKVEDSPAEMPVGDPGSEPETGVQSEANNAESGQASQPTEDRNTEEKVNLDEITGDEAFEVQPTEDQGSGNTSTMRIINDSFSDKARLPRRTPVDPRAEVESPSETPEEASVARENPYADSDAPSEKIPSERIAARSVGDLSVDETAKDLRAKTESVEDSIPERLDYSGFPAAPLRITRDVARLRPGIERALRFFYLRPENAPGRSNWGMMHSIMVFGTDTNVLVGRTQYNAIAWIAGNNLCRGQRLLTQDSQGIKAKSGVGLQGHQAQFLAVLSLCNVPSDYQLYAASNQYHVSDLIQQEMKACKWGEELTFSLIALSHYLDTDESWIASDGQRWDVEKLIASELEQPIVGSACGGTHRLMGFGHALRKRRAEGKPITGHWKRAEQFTEDFINYAYSLQNRDGSMSTKWFEGRDDNGDVDRKIQTTGHIVEWLLTVTPNSQLQDRRLVAAVRFLHNAMVKDLGHDWSIGPKGHALRSLAMYHERVFQAGRPWTQSVAPTRSRVTSGQQYTRRYR